jgi:cAMP phosphodiesterase
MNIQVLGCHGAEQRVQQAAGPLQHESCGFLIDETTLLDAGTIGSKLTLAEQRRIRFVLLSHLHFDHIKGLPTMVDNLAEAFDESLVVVATEPVLQGLRDHVFNDKVYPNFFELPNRTRPILKTQVLEPGKPVTLNHLEVLPIRVNHTVPTVGFIVNDGRSALLYSGDTYETEEIWAKARMISQLKAVFIESSFPNQYADLARQTKHLTPTLLTKEWSKLQNTQMPVYAYHLKPPFYKDIERELTAVAIPHLSVLKEGQVLTL